MGPVATTLESELRAYVRRHAIVVWLDLDDHYSAFVDDLTEERRQGRLPYGVHGYRGSFLELLLALESETGGSDPTPLVVHLPGVNEESIRKTPLLELYEAGARFRKALPTLIHEAATGRVPPERVAAFIERGELTLSGADAWLAATLGERGDGLPAILDALRLTALMDDLLATGSVAERLEDPASLDILREHLRAVTGMPPDWQRTLAPAGAERAGDIPFVVAAWALCVEYSQDLVHAPADGRLAAARALAPPLVASCRELCVHLRERHPPFYLTVSEDTAAWLGEEIARTRAEELGSTDTFRFEEETILDAALAALGAGRWRQALDWAAPRLGEGPFWLRREPARVSSWSLVEALARLGAAMEAAGAGLGATTDLAGAVARYREAGAPVDQAHRHLEQRRLALLHPQIPRFEVIRERVGQVLALWQHWAEAWALDFNALCLRSGFLPEPSLRQRSLFAEVVEPLAGQTGTTALVLVDALRYEMAEELTRLLGNLPATRMRLDARLAELPTDTAVGMNALAPVSRGGRLHPVVTNGRIEGFQAGEFRVTGPEERRKAMRARVGGAKAPWLSLEDVLAREEASLKKTIGGAQLVMVSSLEIDEAGEKGVGPAVFDQAIHRLRAAWKLLRDAGVRRFVITADHGFLLLDALSGSAQTHGRKIDPGRRHVLSPLAADHKGEVRVPLGALGYEGTDLHLMMPQGIALFDTGRRRRGFAHGGNSLQERVIPVLTIEHRAPAGIDTMHYAIQARTLEGVAGMHCIEAQVVPAAQGALDFGGAAEIALALRVVDDAATQVSLCQVRGGARLTGTALIASVEQRFEVFFRLSGPDDARVLVELMHPTAEARVEALTLDDRFAVTALRTRQTPEPALPEAPPEAPGADWLSAFADEAVRRVFAHLAEHGALTETEAAALLGGARALRRFSSSFEDHARKAPFGVHIDVVAGVKRYVKDGTGP